MKFSAKSTPWKKSTMGIKKYFEMADYEKTMYHNMCDVANILFWERCVDFIYTHMLWKRSEAENQWAK